MTDGNMGIQVAPTEDEMAKVQDIFKRALDAIVGMSQLQADVDMLRKTVQSLQSDADRLRNQNAGLDEALYQSRQARHNLEAEVKANHNAMLSAQAERDQAQRQRDWAETELASTKEGLHQALDERDEAQFRVLELEEKLKAAEYKLTKVQEVFGIPTPPDVPNPVQVVEFHDPAPEPQAESIPAPVPPTRTYLDGWAPGALWDSAAGGYYREA